MAEQLLLAMRDDFINDATTLNLLAWLAQEGWQMSLGDGETPVDEAMTLHVPGTSDNDLAVNMQALDALIVRVDRFKNSVEPYGMWLRTQLPGETGARQALILDAKRDKAQVVDRFAQQQHMLRDYILGLKRTSAWEDTAYLTTVAAQIGTIGDMADLGEVSGDIPARLARTRIEDINGGTSPFSNVWIGLRSNRFGIAAQFVPRWEAELGHLASNVALTTANDATATGESSNKSIRVTFTDPTMQPRWWMSVAEAAEFPDGQAGRMLVLGRFKVSDGSTVCRVRLESGFAGTTAYHQRGKVVVSGTDWVIYPLGQVTLPETGRGMRSLSLISNQRLRISADRYAGSGTLDMDCLILIPTDEGFISLQSETTLQSLLGPVQYPLLISRSADDRVMASGYTVDSGFASTYYSDLQVQVEGGMPTSDHVQIVLAAQRSTGSILQDEVDLIIDVYRRWLTLRGATGGVVFSPVASMLNSKIVSLGDSITAGTANNQMSDYPRWLQFAMGRTVINAGVGGNSVDQVYARLGTDVIAKEPGVCVIMVGTNSLGGFDSPITDVWQSITTDLLAAGIYPLWCTIIPRSDLPEHKPQIIRLRTWLLAYAAGLGLNVADTWAAFADGNGDPITGLLIDGLHPTTLGATTLSATIQAAFPSWSRIRSIVYPPVSGNLITNGGFSGSAGVPTGWFPFPGDTYGVMALTAHPVSGNWWSISKPSTDATIGYLGGELDITALLERNKSYRLAFDLDFTDTVNTNGCAAYITYVAGDTYYVLLIQAPQLTSISNVRAWCDFTVPDVAVTAAYIYIFASSGVSANDMKIGRLSLEELA